MEEFKCKFCGKEFPSKRAVASHQLSCILNPNRDEHINKLKKPRKKTGKCWNKGLTKDTSEIIKKMGENYSLNYSLGKYKSNSHPHTDEAKEKIREARIKYLNEHGLKEGRYRSIYLSGYYKGIYCASSYELIYLVWNIEHNIKIERCQNSFKYTYNNETHTYFPDFYLIDTKEYVEIKGRNQFYDSELIDTKLKSIDGKYKILYDEDIKALKPYFKEKYGLKTNKEICEYFYDKD